MKGLFVPGLYCRSEIWEAAPAGLPGVEVAALDWPWPERLDSLDACAAWLAGEIECHGANFVVGHSFGGIVALHLGPPLPLVIVDTFLVTPHPFFRNHVWEPTTALGVRIAAMLADERPRFPVLGVVASADDPPEWRDRVLRQGARFVYGGRSGEHPATALGELAGVPAGHDVRVVPRSSHFLMLERPEPFYATLRALL